MKEPILCYIAGNWAYFTTAPLDEQWGDDWNDAPYEHNAGEPYCDEGQEITKIAFEAAGFCQTPCERSLDYPEGISVDDVNNKKAAWLESSAFAIWAGTTLSKFKKIIRDTGGKVYTEEPEGNGLQKLQRINNEQD